MASPTEVTINSISAATYPVDVFVCSGCPDTNCVLVDTITSAPVTITIPPPYDLDPTFSVSIVDSENCIYCQTFGTTTTSTTTINPICEICSLGFDFYETNPISEISVGVVTGSCDPSITDYVIDWYGPGIGSTNIAFTSGLGSLYSGDYTYIHPLTGASAVPVVAGIYTPIIRIITIDGVEYTDANCFSSTNVDVDALTCINGSPTNYPQYSHKISFSATTNQIPQPVTSTFALDPSKPYFAYRILTFSIYDEFKITFYGSDYSDPIVLEYLKIGDDVVQTDFEFTTIPKEAKTYPITPNTWWSKVLTLTGITINSGDYLEIEITPNQTNNNTSYELYCECLESFDCGLCYNTNQLPPFKIITSTISQTTPTVCGQIDLTFQLSACTDSDLYRYMTTNGYFQGTAYSDTFYNYLNGVMSFNDMSPITQSVCFQGTINLPSNCSTPNSNLISFSKTVSMGEGLINMTFSDLTDLQAYYNSWQTLYTSYSGNPSDCNDINYYRYFILRVPTASGVQLCGDFTGFQNYFIHPSAIVTTGGTGPYTMSITMPVMSDCITYPICDVDCEIFKDGIIIPSNSSSTGTTNNISIVSNTGSRLISPFEYVRYLNLTNLNNNYATQTFVMYIPQYINETIPYSGSPLTIISELSGKTCEFNDWTLSNNVSNNGNFYTNIGAGIKIVRPNPLNVEDFEIYSYTPVNGTWVGYPLTDPFVKIYEEIGGVPNVINPSFFI
jgi:hypothetical protein